MRAVPLFCLYLVLLLGCKRNEAVKIFGPDFNTERAKLGLRVIKPDAVLTNNHEYIYPLWINPVRQKDGNPHSVHWVSKQVEIQNGAIVTETETYSSGREYPVLEKDVREEQLVIRYDYRKARAGENPWWCKIFWGPKQGDYSLEQAETILKEWGMSRL